MKAAKYALGGAVLAASLAGCGLIGGSAPTPTASPGAAAPSSTAPSDTTTSMAPSTAAPSSRTPAPMAPSSARSSTRPPSPTAKPVPVMPGRCTTADLKVALGTAGHAAGSAFEQIVFTDESTAACTLAGYPGAALTGARSESSQIGAAAARNPVAAHTVTLKPGRAASALLQVADAANFPQAQGHTVTSAYLQVFVPDQGVPVYLPLAVTGTTVTSVRLLTVSPVT